MVKSLVPVLLPGDPAVDAAASRRGYVTTLLAGKIDTTDGRLTDARTPTAHAASHAAGGTDAITTQSIGAVMGTTPTPTKTANYTAAAGEMVLVDASAGPITITLPVISANGQRAAVKKIDSSVNIVTVAAGAGNTIGSAGAASVPIRLQDQTGNYQAYGTGWVLPHSHLGLPSLDARFVGAADARLSDARTPLAHAHTAGDVTSGVLDIARIPTGQTGTTVPLGNDARLSDARTPTAHGHAGTDITSGTVPYARLPVGTAASTIAAGDDSRLTNARVPTAHAVSHSTGGSDVLSPAAIGAAPALTPTSTKTANYTAAYGELVKVDATAGPITITIPVPLTGAVAGVRKTDSTSNSVIVTDGGSLSFTLKIPDESRILISQASTWFTSYGLMTYSGLDTRYSPLPGALRTINPSGGNISINADTNGNNINSTLSGDATVAVPTGGADTQVLQGTALASTATRVLSFAVGLSRLSPVPASLSIPSGKIARYSLRRTDITGSAKWVVEAAGIES